MTDPEGRREGLVLNHCPALDIPSIFRKYLLQLSRALLGWTQQEIADKVGVSEHQLKCWEIGDQQPSGKQHSFWKLRLSDYVDEEISTLIGTKNAELVTNFLEILWRLND